MTKRAKESPEPTGAALVFVVAAGDSLLACFAQPTSMPH